MFTGQVGEESNRADVEWLFSIVDEDTGDEADLTSAAIVVEVSEPEGCMRWTGSIASGDIILAEPTTMRILIPRASMLNLCAGTYIVGMTVTNAGLTKSVIVGSMAVVNGAVPQ